MRIVRVPVFHEGTFRAMLGAVCRGQGWWTYRGERWELVERGRGFAIYRRAPFGRGWLQEWVEEYEFYLYSRLLRDQCGRDGVLRPRTRLRSGPDGVYRAAAGPSHPGPGMARSAE